MKSVRKSKRSRRKSKVISRKSKRVVKKSLKKLKKIKRIPKKSYMIKSSTGIGSDQYEFKEKLNIDLPNNYIELDPVLKKLITQQFPLVDKLIINKKIKMFMKNEKDFERYGVKSTYLDLYEYIKLFV